MNANDYKEYKGLRKESLRDNMSDIEVALTSIGEIATKDIAQKEKPKTFKENVSIAKRELIRATRKKDDDAFQLLVEKYHDMIYKIIN